MTKPMVLGSALGKSIATSKPLDTAGLKKNALDAGGTAPGEAKGTQYVGFNGNTGALVWGKNKAAIPETQKFIVAVPTLMHGWMYWENKKPENDTKVLISGFHPFPDKPDARPLVGDLPRPNERNGWKDVYSFNLYGVGDALDTFELNFEHSSAAFQQLWGDIAMAVVKQSETNEGTTFIHPVLTLTVGSYENTTYDRTVYTLSMELLGWSDGTTIQDISEDAPVEDNDDILG